MKIEEKLKSTKAQMRKGVLEFCILSIIEKGEIYPSDIIKILDKSKLEVKQGTIYPLLTRLKNSGLLGYSWKESTQGPPRKYYHLTEIGQTFLYSLHDTWNSLVASVSMTTATGQAHADAEPQSEAKNIVVAKADPVTSDEEE